MIREGTIEIPFEYAAGETGSRFLIALRDERKILGSRCPSCTRTLCPPASFCPRCGVETNDLREVGPTGIVEQWTHVPDKGVFLLVRLDGADTAMVHRWCGDEHHCRVGLRVRARFRDDRRAHIDAILGFEALEG